MKITKLTWVSLLLALLVCAFVACGGPAESETETKEESETKIETEAHVHDTEVRVAKEATCIAGGLQEEVCKTCGEVVDSKVIAKIDHVEAAPATCTTDAVCSACGKVLTKATGHSYGEFTVTKVATCEQGGEQSKTCATCGDVYTETLPVVAHTIANATETKESTISTAGYVKGTCSTCNKVVTNELPAGVTLNIEALDDGLLADGFTADAGFDFFDVTVDEPTPLIIEEKGEGYVGVTPEWLSVVTDSTTGNKYIAKTEGTPTDAGVNFIDSTGILNGSKFEISFDYRVESDTNNGGVLSLNSRDVAKADEMRILSVWSGNKVCFGTNNKITLLTVDPTNPEWHNYRIVVNGATYDYEIWLDGVKVLYTVSDATATDGHAVYFLENGEFVAKSVGSYGDQSPFKNVSGAINSIYFFHYNKPAGSLDNLRIAVLEPVQ